MKTRILALLLACCLLAALLPTCVVSAEEIDTDAVVWGLYNYFKGDYDKYVLIYRTDNGASSIGVLQWHGTRGLTLLQRIVEANPDQALEILGQKLYDEITGLVVEKSSDDPWGTRILTEAEAKLVAQLLGTQEGRAAQDAQGYEDISYYVMRGNQRNIHSNAAMLYYCDFANQYGVYGADRYLLNPIKAKLGKDSIDSLAELHNGVLGVTKLYRARRNKTYDYITKTLGWDPGTCCPSLKFFDMLPESHWGHQGIDFCLEHQLFNGMSEYDFGPEGLMTRGMLVTVLYRLDGAAYTAAEAPFADVPMGRYYTDAVAWAADSGVVNGVGGGRFAPDDNVTREQIATVLCRYAAAKGVDTQTSGDLEGFTDADQVSAYARQAMLWANSAGIVRGSGSGAQLSLLPRDNATRVQVATMMMRFWQEVAG